MIDKLSDAAEKLATSLSRRYFLVSLGRWAGASALAMAGVLTTGRFALAGNNKGVLCCYCYSSDGSCFYFVGCYQNGCPVCPSPWSARASSVNNCKHCYTGGGCV